MNLKGNVSKVECYYRHIKEEWGEEKEVLCPSRRFYFNPSGNLVYAQILGGSEWYDNYEGETAVTKQYLYDSSGRLVTVMYFHANGEQPDSGIKEIKGFPEKAEYEYDSSGRLHSITNYRLDINRWKNDHGSYSSYRGDEFDPQSGYSECAKEVWNYTADGFTHIVCNREGRTLLKEVATEHGKKVDGRGGISIYDDAGHLLARGGSFVADNGAASYAEFFGYNKQGDLVVESSNADVQKQLKTMPWLKASYNRHGDFFYEYVYDDHENWIERKKFKTLNGNREPKLENTLVRVIEYGQFGSLNASSEAPKSTGNPLADQLYLSEDKREEIRVSVTNTVKGLKNVLSGSEIRIKELKSEYDSNDPFVEEEIANLKESWHNTYGSAIASLYGELFGPGPAHSELEDLDKLIEAVELKYPGSSMLAPIKELRSLKLSEQ